MACGLRLQADMPGPKRYVYVLRSGRDRTRYYTGVTSSLLHRLAAHNAGQSPHTADGTPWEVDVSIEFADERRALAFERYLKSGSGCAFAKRHFR
jgi:predicted GIY-YIG superfamily endonuclease